MKNPYHHLREFEQVCSCLKILGMTHETLKWKLFPLSLSEEAKQWYIRVVGYVNENWIELRDDSVLRSFRFHQYLPYERKF